MGNENETPSEQPLTSDDKNRILLIESLKRMNSDLKDEDLEKANNLTLEALYNAEKIKANSVKEEPKPSFIKAPISHTPPVTKTEKKENKTDEEARFNALEVFKPQYIDPSRLVANKVNEDCEILTMRVNANPKFPEYQVS